MVLILDPVIPVDQVTDQQADDYAGTQVDDQKHGAGNLTSNTIGIESGLQPGAGNVSSEYG